MIEQTGQVFRVEGDRAWIACRPAVCRACQEGRGCGAGVFAAMLNRRPSGVVVRDGHGLGPGDDVVLGLDERGLLRAAASLYGLPLAGLLAGSLLGAVLGGSANDAAVLAGSISGLAAGLVRQRLMRASLPQPVILGLARAAGDRTGRNSITTG